MLGGKEQVELEREAHVTAHPEPLVEERIETGRPPDHHVVHGVGVGADDRGRRAGATVFERALTLAQPDGPRSVGPASSVTVPLTPVAYAVGLRNRSRSTRAMGDSGATGRRNLPIKGSPHPYRV